MTTLAELIVAPTKEQVFNGLLADYQAAGFPVTAWQPGGTERTRLMAIATAIVDFGAVYVPAIAGGSLLDYAPNYPGWTALTADQIYDVQQLPATFTQGNILATNASTVAYPYSASTPLKITFSVSNRSYFSVGSGTIPASGSVTIPVQAEFAGAAYIEPNSSGGILLTTPLPGVTLTNPASTFGSVTHTGSGSGTIAPTGTPPIPHSLQIVMTSTGEAGVATWSYSLDNGTPIAAGAVTSAGIVNSSGGSVGITVTLANGTPTPSFVIGDTYTITNPGSWITSQGSDIESDTALAQRCRDRWSTLADIPTGNFYDFLARSVPGVGSQVTACTVVPDGTINNKVNIIVSGPGGVLPAPTIAAIQAYITPKARGCDYPVVGSPSTQTITIAATITASAAQLSNVQASVTAAVQSYVASVPVNGVIRIAEIIDAVMSIDPGVIDCTGVTINGAASNLTLGSISAFVLPAYPPTLGMVYITQ